MLMTTQLTIRIDEQLKQRLTQKTKQEWISLKTAFQFLSQLRIDDKVKLWM